MLKYAISRHHPDRCIATPVSGPLDWRRESASRWCWVWRGGWRRRCRRSRAGRQNPLEPPPDWILSWLPWAQLGGGKRFKWDEHYLWHHTGISSCFIVTHLLFFCWRADSTRPHSPLHYCNNEPPPSSSLPSPGPFVCVGIERAQSSLIKLDSSEVEPDPSQDEKNNRPLH